MRDSSYSNKPPIPVRRPNPAFRTPALLSRPKDRRRSERHCPAPLERRKGHARTMTRNGIFGLRDAGRNAMPDFRYKGCGYVSRRCPYSARSRDAMRMTSGYGSQWPIRRLSRCHCPGSDGRQIFRPNRYPEAARSRLKSECLPPETAFVPKIFGVDTVPQGRIRKFPARFRAQPVSPRYMIAMRKTPAPPYPRINDAALRKTIRRAASSSARSIQVSGNGDRPESRRRTEPIPKIAIFTSVSVSCLTATSLRDPDCSANTVCSPSYRTVARSPTAYPPI